MNIIKRNALYLILIGGFAVASTSADAALAAYVTQAITDAKTELTDLVAAMVPAAIVLVLLALTPRVLLKMIRALGSKVSF